MYVYNKLSIYMHIINLVYICIYIHMYNIYMYVLAPAPLPPFATS